MALQSRSGLTTAAAQAQLRKFGPNQITSLKKFSEFTEFLIKFRNPLVLILLAAALISAFFGDWTSSVIIIAIVALSVLMDFFNTYRSEKAAEALRERVRITASVIRDGKAAELPLAQIVPDDVVVLAAGDIIPADAVILESNDFYVNESSLTGESFPQTKEASATVFMGSSVISGTAAARVTATGSSTQYSHITQDVGEPQGPTEFERSISSFSFLVMKITFILVIVIFLINAGLKHNVLESFLFAAALAVGLTPELLPMIIALNLSKGSLAMSRRGVIVKRLASIQNFGSMDVLCTDKTGTLTEDRIEVIKYVDGSGKTSETVLEHAYVSSSYHTGFNNPLDSAIREYRKIDIRHYKKLAEIPFDYTRRRDSIVAARHDRKAKKMVMISKGQPEELLKICQYYETPGAALTGARHKIIEKTYTALSRDGFRVLAVAAREIPATQKTYGKDLETGLVFLGFVAFYDPPKKSVSATLKKLEEYGLEIKVVTGDDHLVTEHIAGQINLASTGTLLGSDIAKLSLEALRVKVEQNTIFARVSPDQKRMVIRALQANHHVVGYMGDGINDAPSLRAADVGISVDNAVDIAKDAADLILMKKSLRDLVDGVIEGRRTFRNTLKYLMMALSSNYGNMFSMAIASLFLPFLPMLPTQILLNNLLYDSSQFAIPLDNVDAEELRRPQKFNIKFLKKFMLIFGPISSVFDLLTFGLLLVVFGLGPHGFQTGWFLESLASQAFVVYVIRTRRSPFFNSRPSRILVGATLLAVLAGWLLALSPLGSLFQFEPIGALPIISILVIVFLYVMSVELVKDWFYRHMAKRAAA
jgi:P-type Mg2+ transporter